MGTLYLSTKRDRRHLKVVGPNAASIPILTATGKRVVLALGHAMPQGIPVTLQLGSEDKLPEIAKTGWLPPVQPLIAAYENWQQTYRQMLADSAGSASRLSAPAVQMTNVSYRETIQTCCQLEKVLTKHINQWLNSELFRPVRETLLAYCHPDEIIRLILQTDDLQVQRLPLHRWDWFKRYPQAELVLGSATYAHAACARFGPASQLRILAILGDSHGLEVEQDLASLDQLPNAVVTCLREPMRSHLTETLWDYPWDIVLFAGHSTYASQPKLRLNKYDSLSLSELKHALKRAVKHNLKLLILNTCDSLALLKSLNSGLCLPTTIAMRQPVPDAVAHTFLRYFLFALSQGQPLPQSVREAREKLQGIEQHFPFSSWLPVLTQAL